MKRGFVTGLMLLIATLLLVTLGYLPTSIEAYQDTGVKVVGNSLFAQTAPAKFNETCGKMNGVDVSCQGGFVCSNGKCKLKIGSNCRANSDCESGSLCSTLSAGEKKMSICLKPQ